VFWGELGIGKFEQPAVMNYVLGIFVGTERPKVTVSLLVAIVEVA
jgi:hypothetical protein